ncbi:shikimate 5-dehydrogenase [Denitrovibrio acetiphilus DSM 12809]|uniref:Shikimate dehydrogenase (NADP(+)) n=1 Tax=Denitrovibrio acetiphilus (strain DSM 12809 / NBRC 114555 / N2460) TaxID=522772 RepID=D4H7V6_DENA2|nr:shikimate dehydrogenase [Denitrovibrio acetiphilus]ADD68105.1 shikimate 5-dehydrogenase [Denitrovibrio acetiphilus DSM 12809]
MFVNLGLVGQPLQHSFSPFIQTCFLKSSGINGGFCCFETDGGESLKETFLTLRQYGFKGVNVTVPHKQAVIDIVDTLDPVAETVGAVNTVRIGDRLEGFNTDAEGFERMLLDAGYDLSGKDVLLLGCGGASMAVLYVLKKYNVRLTVVNRTLSKAEAVLKSMSFDNVQLQDYNFIKGDSGFHYVINGTSIGLEDGNFPDMNRVECSCASVDLQYKKGLTPFLQSMRGSSCGLLDGFSMLVYQAAKAFEIWTGVYPEFSVETISGELGLS